jgi:DNA (cytosine-5)-methyltransferase 1
MKPGMLYSDLPKDLRRYRADIFDDKYNRLSWDDLSRSITAHIAKDGYWYVHPDQHRTLTVREAARVQTFPDHFRFAGTRSRQFHQIGNAVPPALSEAIGRAILGASRTGHPDGSRPSRSRAEFRELLAGWAAFDRQIAPWAYPADPWPIAVGLVLGSKGEAGWPTPADVLDLAPMFADATPRLLATLVAMADPGRRRLAAERLVAAAAAVRSDPAGWSGAGWAKAAGLGPAGRDWFGVLAGDGLGLVASTAVLRVTARVTGSDVDRQNRNSAGRMELAKLVGGGEAAPTLNAAMHRLGTAVCTTGQPACHACPVRGVCAGRAL